MAGIRAIGLLCAAAWVYLSAKELPDRKEDDMSMKKVLAGLVQFAGHIARHEPAPCWHEYLRNRKFRSAV